MQGAERERQPNFNQRIPPRKEPKQKRTKKFTSVGFSMMQNSVLLALTSCFIFLSPLRSFPGFKQRQPLQMKTQLGLSHQCPGKETKYFTTWTICYPSAYCYFPYAIYVVLQKHLHVCKSTCSGYVHVLFFYHAFKFVLLNNHLTKKKKNHLTFFSYSAYICQLQGRKRYISRKIPLLWSQMLEYMFSILG